MTKKEKIKIEGMHCASCARAVDFSLEEIPGVKSVHTDYAKGETQVEFEEGKVDLGKIEKTIEEIGYRPLHP